MWCCTWHSVSHMTTEYCVHYSHWSAIRQRYGLVTVLLSTFTDECNVYVHVSRTQWLFTSLPHLWASMWRVSQARRDAARFVACSCHLEVTAQHFGWWRMHRTVTSDDDQNNSVNGYLYDRHDCVGRSIAYIRELGQKQIPAHTIHSCIYTGWVKK